MKTIFGFIFLSLFAVLEARYRCDYTYFDEVEGWLKLHMIPANWRDAALRCQLERGHLASPLNSKFRKVIQTIIAQQAGSMCTVHTGIHATFSKGVYSSIEGVSLMEISHSWAENEPNNENDGENCITMLADGKLADVSCDKPFPYICYKKAPKNVQLCACGTLEHDYTLDSRTGSCYKFHRVPRTWPKAYMACAAEGGHLAVINSETESTVLQDLFKKNPANAIVGPLDKDYAMIGFAEWERWDYITVDGRRLKEAGFATFASGEPNNSSPDRYCGAIHRNGLLDDLQCNKEYAFICEKPPGGPVCADPPRAYNGSNTSWYLVK